MSSVKARMAEIIQAQPEDATYEEIMRGLTDSRNKRVITNDEMARRIRAWQK